MTKKYIPLTARDAHEICFACKRGEFDNVLNLLTNDPELDICVEDNYPFRIACENGHLEIVKLLMLYKCINPSAHDNYAFKRAALNGHLDVVKYLLENCPSVDPTAENNYAIRWAAHCGHYEVVDLLAKNERVSETWDFVMKEFDEIDTTKKCCGCVII